MDRTKLTAIFTLFCTLAVACGSPGAAAPTPVTIPSAIASGSTPTPMPPSTDNDLAVAPNASSEEDAAIPIDASDPVRGNRNALVTIVEFSDFQCPFCGRVEPTIAQVLETYGEKVRLVWKNEPLPFHPFAQPAAEIGAGVHALGGDQAFFRFKDATFRGQSSLSREALLGWAQDAGVDGRVLEDGLTTHRWAGKVATDLALSNKLGANGTPAFFVNGVSLSGAQPFSKFKEVIDGQINHANALLERGTAPDRIYAVAAGENFHAGKDTDDDTPKEDTTTVFKVPVGHSPIRGSANAQVTIVEFADFQCPFCKRVEDTLKQVRDTYGTKVRFVWKDEPLPFHPRAMPAANFARAARTQRGDAGFWDVHDRLFASQPQLEDADLSSIAASAGLRVSDALAAARTSRFSRDISVDTQLGDDVQAAGTPHFFINGRRLVGAQPFDRFKTIIDEEITKTDALIRNGTPAAQIYERVIASGRGAPPLDTKTVRANPNAPFKGAANARVVIQEFGDFQCPFCGRAEQTIDQVMRDYGTRVKLVWRNKPLPMHTNAEPAAEAAMEARKQKGNDGFWRMHKLLFDHQSALDRASLDGYASTLGLDMSRFDAALDGQLHKAEIAADSADADAAGISGTPAFLVGPYFINGAQPYAKFQKAIEQALGGQPTSAAAAPSPSPSPAPAAAATGSATTLGKQDIVVGSGAAAKTGDHLVVHYTGTLTDGTVFDSSRTRGQPFDFVVGQGRVIQGWEQGLIGMKVGGRRKLTIPPDLGYGARGAGAKIPPNSTLVFDVELIEIRP